MFFFFSKYIKMAKSFLKKIASSRIFIGSLSLSTTFLIIFNLNTYPSVIRSDHHKSKASRLGFWMQCQSHVSERLLGAIYTSVILKCMGFAVINTNIDQSGSIFIYLYKYEILEPRRRTTRYQCSSNDSEMFYQ